MLYLIWSLLNIGLIIYLLVICYRALKLLREKYGWGTAVFFVIGVISLSSSSTPNNHSQSSKSNKDNSWNFTSEEQLEPHSTLVLTIELEDDLISSKEIRVKYAKLNKGHYRIPINAQFYSNGFTSGAWEPIAINVNQTKDNNKFRYNVIGVVNWKLIGTTVYRQSKRFKGIISVK